jgi:fatty-acyl-CoA synthase
VTSTPRLALRSLQDVEELERVPLAVRFDTWDFAEWLRRGMAAEPEKPALAFVHDGNPETAPELITHAALWRRAIQIGNLLRSVGVGDNDAVAIVLPTVPALYASLIGSLATAVAFPLNWMLAASHLGPLMARAQTRAIIALGPAPGFDIWEKVLEARRHLPGEVPLFSVEALGGERLSATDLDTLASMQSDRWVGRERLLSGDETAACVHSGGTTGAPKVVKLTHRGFCYRHWTTTHTLSVTRDEVVLGDTPLFHIGGLNMRGLSPIASGNTVLIPGPLGARDKVYLGNYWNFVERYGVTRLSGVPTTLSVLVKSPPAPKKIASLRNIFATGSTALPVAIHRALEEKIGVRPLVMYGMTENTGNLTLDPRDGPTKYGSSGIRVPYTHIRSVQIDRDGRILRDSRTDEIGALIYRGPGVTSGYADPAQSRAAFVDGWFNSGDLGRIDEDGYVFITGRARDVIIRGGHNIDPAMIEEALLKSQEVALVAAVGKPDAHAGEVPVAYVELVAGSHETAENLMDVARRHVAERPALPREIILIPRMPLTDVGKPRKVVLREDAARRAFFEVLSPVLSDILADIEIAADPVHGTIAVLRVRPASENECTRVRENIARALAGFSLAHRIEWESAPAETASP